MPMPHSRAQSVCGQPCTSLRLDERPAAPVVEGDADRDLGEGLPEDARGRLAAVRRAVLHEGRRRLRRRVEAAHEIGEGRDAAGRKCGTATVHIQSQTIYPII